MGVWARRRPGVGAHPALVAYGTPSSPTLADSASIGGGANFFAGGTNSPVATATQTVDVSGAAAEIDADTISATVGAALGGFETPNDNGTITATYQDTGGAAWGPPSPDR